MDEWMNEHELKSVRHTCPDSLNTLSMTHTCHDRLCKAWEYDGDRDKLLALIWVALSIVSSFM